MDRRDDNQCYEEMLDKIQMADPPLFSDSKTFVDRPWRQSKAVTLEAFRNATNITEFVDKYFEVEGQEMEEWNPTDYKEKVSLIEKIRDPLLREFAEDLNRKWGLIGRRIKIDVKNKPEKYSLIYLPEPFIIPGGRFREVYYWDSYWVVLGLLRMEMTTTVKSMLTNFLHLVDEYGFVPNGGRKYYLNRSQPPMLIPMMMEYYTVTNDTEFVHDNFHLLEKEYRYWMSEKVVDVEVNGTKYRLNRYLVNTTVPRPESYREDKHLAENLPQDKKEQLYSNLASAAESGWDFSTRWFPDGYKDDSLRNTRTTQIIPVDLNAFLAWNERIMADFSSRLGNGTSERYYRQQYETRVSAIDKVLWNEIEGAWFDYDLTNKTQIIRFYASTVTPIFTKCHGLTDAEKMRKEGLFTIYLKKPDQEVYRYIYGSGLPTSRIESGQQWDEPNAWPPLQHMWGVGLHNAADPKLVTIGVNLMDKWIITCLKGWLPKRNMFEKYNALDGTPGSGGEYDVQIGFGWSNGVVLDMLFLVQPRLPDDLKNRLLT